VGAWSARERPGSVTIRRSSSLAGRTSAIRRSRGGSTQRASQGNTESCPGGEGAGGPRAPCKSVAILRGSVTAASEHRARLGEAMGSGESAPQSGGVPRSPRVASPTSASRRRRQSPASFERRGVHGTEYPCPCAAFNGPRPNRCQLASSPTSSRCRFARSAVCCSERAARRAPCRRRLWLPAPRAEPLAVAARHPGPKRRTPRARCGPRRSSRLPIRDQSGMFIKSRSVCRLATGSAARSSAVRSSDSTCRRSYTPRPVPAGMRRPMITFSFRPRR